MKTTIVLFSIAILVYPILVVEAINKTQGISDCIQSSECTTQTFIIEKQNKQIANLTEQVIELQSTENTNLTVGIVGAIIGLGGIGGMIYEIKKKRQLLHSQLKTDKARRSAYNSTKQAKDAEKTKHQVETAKKFWDWWTGK
ncbi:MAG: hypothetical protein ACREA3_10600 [Nitrosotalea sp.]